jgi:carbon storage regulator
MGYLVLSRKKGEAVVIDGPVTIRVLSVDGSRVRIGFDADPRTVTILREEVAAKLEEPKE